MAPVPGVKQQDGSINHSVAGIVTGCSILAKSKNVEQAWKFIKWWTQENTQSQYSQELETIMGAAARNPSANLETRKNISWSGDMENALDEQFAYVRSIPEVAGGYYTSRHFDFAFRNVVYDGKDIIETINNAESNINTEISSKLKEFNINTGNE